ncbi:DnaJ family domain-containing protein [Brachybacterium huguangmaarense]
MIDPRDAVDEAIARGDFDDLPGAGRPLDLPRVHDPDWWIRQRLRDEDLDRDALLPAGALLRREREAIGTTLEALDTEDQVRAYLEDFNARVLEDRRRNPIAVISAVPVDVEDRVERWRAGSEERPAARLAQGRADGAAGTGRSPGARRRSWWARLLER